MTKRTPQADFSDEYVASLFDRMGPTYDLVNRVSSFGFCELWRYQCVRHLPIREGSVVCDMMSGSGECWPYLLARKPARLESIDFSGVMIGRQKQRFAMRPGSVVIRHENATKTSLPDASVDYLIAAFGLKTLSPTALDQFAREIHRLLKPGGAFSLLEISDPSGWLLAPVYRWYVSRLIPLIGKVLLGDIECYRMLGVYTQSSAHVNACTVYLQARDSVSKCAGTSSAAQRLWSAKSEANTIPSYFPEFQMCPY
jgi:demethylmenaquinone methyltransferase/2-methoxy-6-polyprenyl-1,4-benzoquinol methylase